jgi:hypothetical protein
MFESSIKASFVCSDHRRWVHSEKHARLCLFLATSRASLIANRISCSALKSSDPYRRALEARLVLLAFLHNSIYANVSSFTGERSQVRERIYRAACSYKKYVASRTSAVGDGHRRTAIPFCGSCSAVGDYIEQVESEIRKTCVRTNVSTITCRASQLRIYAKRAVDNTKSISTSGARKRDAAVNTASRAALRAKERGTGCGTASGATRSPRPQFAQSTQSWQSL